LQHGVTKDDLSAWLNTKVIDCFVTAAKPEYKSIALDNNKYKFTSKEVVLTGFPRHDNLIKKNHSNNKSIMIMPTWREYLNELTVENSHKFRDTTYGKAWISLLHSDFLRDMSEKEGYKLRFFPHPNIKKFLKEFDMPDYIELLLDSTESIQVLFQTSDLLLTDYSSVAFEMAILEKQTIYYQFDHQEIFAGAHTYEKGYFNYEKDAFGAICYTQERVIDELKSFVENRGEVNPIYLNRMRNFFAYHDTDNSKRVFEAIINLYSPNIKEISDELLLKYAKDALKSKVWKGVEYRYELLQQRGIEIENIELILSQSKLALGRVDEAKRLIDNYIKKYGSSNQTDEIYQSINRTQTLLNSLSKEDRLLIINEKEDFLLTLTYKNIVQWFRDKKWQLLSVATKLIDKRLIVKKELSYFYYICLVTANEIDSQEDRLFYLPLVKNY